MTTLQMLRSVVGWLVASKATAVLGSAAAVAGVLPGGQRRALAVARLWARICLKASGCRLRVDGLEHVDTTKRYVMMVNHQSALDIPVVLAALPVRLGVSFWAKRSLFSVPFLGWAMRSMGFIPVDRVNRNTAAAMFGASLEQIRAGRSLLIFPEQTYSRGDDLLPFQRGGFLIALKGGLPILPAAIVGTREALPPDARLVRPANLAIRFGEPMPTAGMAVSDREQLTDAVRGAILRLRQG